MTNIDIKRLIALLEDEEFIGTDDWEEDSDDYINAAIGEIIWGSTITPDHLTGKKKLANQSIGDAGKYSNNRIERKAIVTRFELLLSHGPVGSMAISMQQVLENNKDNMTKLDAKVLNHAWTLLCYPFDKLYVARMDDPNRKLSASYAYNEPKSFYYFIQHLIRGYIPFHGSFIGALVMALGKLKGFDLPEQ